MTGERALFVAYESHLRGKGGVQVCTSEFIAALETVGFALEILPVAPDRRITTRALRRVNASPYFRPLSASSLAAIRERALGAQFIFLNQMNLLGGLVPQDFRGVPAIAISHGCELTDQLHLARLHKTLPLSTGQLRPYPTLALARTLRDEVAARVKVEGVIAISPFDADCERWLGTSRVCWIPRTIVPAIMPRQPKWGRFGYVGTLDHAPNLEGLVAILHELERRKASDIVVRVVGGPESIGQWLAAHHRAIDYLGPLDDDALAVEATSWNGFVHPIFCLPRGCSTKLAGALSWGLPIITTSLGRRGYEWREGGVIEVETAKAFVDAMARLTHADAEQEAANAVQAAALSTPTLLEVACSISHFLKPTERANT